MEIKNNDKSSFEVNVLDSEFTVLRIKNDSQSAVKESYPVNQDFIQFHFSVQDAAAMGLKIFVSNEEAVKSIATRLSEISKDAPQRALGPVHLVLSHPELPGEVEIVLKNSYPLKFTS